MKTVYDVIVAGSGAGALAAAVTARANGLDVLIVEKEPFYGGTTALSGGVLWVPCNPKSRELGIEDDIESARRYLMHEAGPYFDPERVDAFLRHGPAMIEFFERQTCVRFVASPGFSDYHPGVPGASEGGRSITAAPFDARRLGGEVGRLRPPLREITFVGMMFNASKEVGHFFNCTRSLTSAAYVARRLLEHSWEMLRYRRAQRLTNGNALVAQLAKSAFDAGVALWTSSPALQLIQRDGRVCGVDVQRDGRRFALHARRGVVLATGGFAQGVGMRRTFFTHAPTGAEHWSPAPPGNTGDGWTLAQAVGGQVSRELQSPAAWIPVSLVPRRGGSPGVFPHLIDRYKPGVIAVLKNGKRFVNEADSYHDFGKAMQQECRDESTTQAWLVCDHQALRRYGLGYVKPFPVPIRPHLRSGYLHRGKTARELAAAIGVDADGLEQTIRSFNATARQGEDPEFGKGTTAYNRYLGDDKHQPNPCVAPLDKPPYYAIRVVMGDLGTFAGIRTDACARVLGRENHPIPGLYAVGNDALSVMGGNYPGGGITIGPAMTFGFIAGSHLAQGTTETLARHVPEEHFASMNSEGRNG